MEPRWKSARLFDRLVKRLPLRPEACRHPLGGGARPSNGGDEQQGGRPSRVCATDSRPDPLQDAVATDEENRGEMMEQRNYRGSVTPEGLADHLVGRYDPLPEVQAQKIGQGSSFLVQLGGGDDPRKIRRALTVAIAAREGEPGITVTMGEQQWLTAEQAGHAAFWGLLGAIITPWALLMLIFPLRELAADLAEISPTRVWEAIELYAASQGATLENTLHLEHPNAPTGSPVG
jgi:hypothetical protein